MVSSSRFWLGFVLCGLLAGCGGEAAKTDPSITDPKTLFDMHCAKCHAQAGQPGGPPAVGSSRGPNLSKIGSEPGRTAEYLAGFIRDPKSKDPGAKMMPGFNGTLTDEQIRALAEYLAAKK